jgi:hypothetical protein
MQLRACDELGGETATTGGLTPKLRRTVTNILEKGEIKKATNHVAFTFIYHFPFPFLLFGFPINEKKTTKQQKHPQTSLLNKFP